MVDEMIWRLLVICNVNLKKSSSAALLGDTEQDGWLNLVQGLGEDHAQPLSKIHVQHLGKNTHGIWECNDTRDHDNNQYETR